MVNLKDIYWAAGFIEGEGCFSYHAICAKVSAVQVQREPLNRIQKIFGGRLGVIRRSKKHPNFQDQGYWAIHGKKAIGVMMTIFEIMSPNRKEQIKKVLEKWRLQRGRGRRGKYKIRKNCSVLQLNFKF